MSVCVCVLNYNLLHLTIAIGKELVIVFIAANTIKGYNESNP